MESNLIFFIAGIFIGMGIGYLIGIYVSGQQSVEKVGEND